MRERWQKQFFSHRNHPAWNKTMSSTPLASEQPREPSGPDVVPEWALTYAEAAIRCGQDAPQIEAALVGKGLSPAQAASAVDRSFGSRIGEQQRSERRSTRLRWVSRGASIFVAALCAGAAFYKARTGVAVRIAVGLLLPMTCIWFPVSLGSYVGPVSWFRRIDRPTPALFVALTGWLLLLGISLTVLALAPK